MAGGPRSRRRSAEGCAGRADRRDRRRPLRCRGDVRAERIADRARRDEFRLPPGRRPARSGVPRRLSVQHDDRRHRAGRRLSARRHQSALGSGARQCAAAKALSARRLPGRGDRPGARDVAGIMEACSSGAIEILHLLGADEIDLSDIGSAIVVYQGHHGDRGAARADVVLPGAAYTEKDATYVNTEGRVQLGRKAVFPPGQAREDWAILRALSGALGRPLHFDSLSELRHMMRAAYSVVGEIDHIVPAEWGVFGEAGPVGPEPFTYPIADFYRT